MAHEFCYPIDRTTLGDYYEMTWRCAKCGYCRNVFPSDTEHERFGRQCPPGERFRFEAYYASGRNELARRTIEGAQGFTDKFRHILYTCTTCAACEEWCEATQGLYPLRLTLAMRKHFVEQGGELLPEHRALVASLRQHHNRLGRNNRDRLGWLDGALPGAVGASQKAKLAYFVGCRSSFRRTEIARAVHELLTRKLGIPVAFLAEERCCGRPLLDLGHEAEARELLRHNLEQIRATGATQVVFSCAECFATFSRLGPYGLEADFEPIHLSQLLAARAAAGGLALAGLRKRAVFQDPCYLGRHAGVFEPPRELLARIPELALDEMPRNRKNAWCCGAGGGVQEAFGEYSQWTAEERVEEAKHAAAELLVTACPGCKENLWARARASRIEVLDLAELMNRQIKA
jgi:Fe-S oxidoreductase